MKTLLAAILTLLSCAILHAQTYVTVPRLPYNEEVLKITKDSQDAELTMRFAWAREVVRIHFDPSKDVVDSSQGPQRTKDLNHDGKAFDAHIWTTHESYDDNVVNYAQNRANVALYKKNIKSGVWKKFVNGE
jgi:hypothetical protein